MNQTTLDNMKYCCQIDEEFTPLRFFKNPHLQTLLPRLLRRNAKTAPYWQRLELPDGDFIDLAWSEDPAQALNKPRAVIFHGLEGSYNSPYAHGLLTAFKERGWLAVVMHFRGCSGEPNRLPRSYHSGDFSDAGYFLDWLVQTYGKQPTAAIGYSLGGNMLACLMGEQGERCQIDAGVIVSAPLMLEPCSSKLEKGFSRFYQRYFLTRLKRSLRRKLKAYPNLFPITANKLGKIRKLREFDDLITAKIYNFTDATDYYRKASGLSRLSGVKKPLLIIHAADDPFMTADVIPDMQVMPNCIEYQLSRYGGHVGYVSGRLMKPVMWLEHRIPSWLGLKLGIEL